MSDDAEIERLRQRVAELEHELEVKTKHLDLATDGYFDWDLVNPDREYMSPKFWTNFGYDPDLKKHDPAEWQDIIHPEDKQTAIAAFEAHVQRGEEYHLTVRYRHAKGHWEHVICRGQVMPGPDGAPQRFVGTHQSITDLKRAQAALEQFAFHAAHDMQEPLRKISVFGDRLQKFEEDLPERGQKYLDRMLDATLRMSKLIYDLLKYARVNRGKPATESVDLNEVFNEVLDDYSTRLSECGGEVTLKELGHVEADWTQVRQLFQNLISNAIKFRRKDVPLEITVRAHQARGMLEVSVRDNGIGFEEKYKNKIFQVFQRLHGRSEYPGTGIGLAVCARIAESHGGTLDAHSEFGEGSVFVVTLPVAEKLNQMLDLPSEPS